MEKDLLKQAMIIQQVVYSMLQAMCCIQQITSQNSRDERLSMDIRAPHVNTRMPSNQQSVILS